MDKPPVDENNPEILIKVHQKHQLEDAMSPLHNGQPAVSRLPHDVLLAIFEEATIEDIDFLKSILWVCRRWYQVATGSPCLWNTISLDLRDTPNPKAIQLANKYAESAIRYSNEALLNLELSLPSQTDLIFYLTRNFLKLTDYDDAADGWGNRYQDTFTWIEHGVMFDHRTQEISQDTAKSLLEFMTTLAGPEGVNLLRLHTFQLSYNPYDFVDWLNNGVFCHPTPNLEELKLEMRLEEPNDTRTFSTIFSHSAPKLSRISVDARCPLYDLLDSHQAVNSLQLKFIWDTLDIFPNQQILQNLKYLLINFSNNFVSSRISNRDILLPKLEDLTIWGICWSTCIKAPELNTLRIFGYSGMDLLTSEAPYFPSVRKLHWHWDGVMRKFEVLDGYIKKFPLLEEIAFVHKDEVQVKKVLSRIRKNPRNSKLVFKGYRAEKEDLISWSAPFPYEYDEIKLE